MFTLQWHQEYCDGVLFTTNDDALATVKQQQQQQQQQQRQVGGGGGGGSGSGNADSKQVSTGMMNQSIAHDLAGLLLPTERRDGIFNLNRWGSVGSAAVLAVLAVLGTGVHRCCRRHPTAPILAPRIRGHPCILASLSLLVPYPHPHPDPVS
jgi:hypothetical protein